MWFLGCKGLRELLNNKLIYKQYFTNKMSSIFTKVRKYCITEQNLNVNVKYATRPGNRQTLYLRQWKISILITCWAAVIQMSHCYFQ